MAPIQPIQLRYPMSASMETVETIPFAAWIWLWQTLVDELGPERAAELLAAMRRIHSAEQSNSMPETKLELGGSRSEAYLARSR
jgi:hypothetical protein